MNTSDKNILHLIDFLIYKKIVLSIRDFCKEINLFEQTISKIKKGIAHFTVQHIETICKVYNVNANWIIGIENEMFISNISNQKSVQTT